MGVTTRGATAPVKPSEVRPLERFTIRSVAGLLAVVGAGTGFGLLLLLVRLSWHPLERVDRGAADSLNRLAAGNSALVAVLLRRQALLAAYIVVTGLGALALDPTLKLLVGRLRPMVAEPVATAPGNSFPSGHALGSIFAYGALLLVFLPIIPRRFRGATIAATVALVVALGFTRVGLGVHYVSDVVAR